MNSESSRSHSLLRMVIESRNKSDTSGAVRIAELYLVDLAGSERQSHTQATGMRLKEGANINKSLLTLSNVIAKLSEGAAGQHIPYRDSKLTRVLERALGGNSRTSIICTGLLSLSLVSLNSPLCLHPHHSHKYSARGTRRSRKSREMEQDKGLRQAKGFTRFHRGGNSDES